MCVFFFNLDFFFLLVNSCSTLIAGCWPGVFLDFALQLFSPLFSLFLMVRYKEEFVVELLFPCYKQSISNSARLRSRPPLGWCRSIARTDRGPVSRLPAALASLRCFENWIWMSGGNDREAASVTNPGISWSSCLSRLPVGPRTQSLEQR